ncbi:MAG TPA: sigma 54-interacting transcriptional regulator [Terriglobia bacterium]|nr:sigma 54-interacting transcriptional regulator [Terriglobia bacterium]
MPHIAGQHESLPGAADSLPPERILFGRSEVMREIRERISKIAPVDVPVLIRGESGTGKELIARFVHSQSAWKDGPFVKVPCPAIPGTLIESELFGYEAGAFTGANHPKPGRVEAAHQGTLFLDEIAELDPTLQVKFLNLLQDGQVCRIGGQEQRPIDVRIICATHRALERDIQAGRFREDLFYRINVVGVHLPPLRERREDIPELAEYFLRLFAAKYALPAPSLSGEGVQCLQDYDWPGNVRELENLINSYVVLGPNEVKVAELLGRQANHFVAPELSEGGTLLKRVGRRAASEAQRRVILEALEVHHGNRKQTAKALHICYRALLYKIKEFGIPPKRALEARRLSGTPTAADAATRADKSWDLDPVTRPPGTTLPPPVSTN